MPHLYQKRPIVIEALQWTGENRDAMWAFTGRDNFYPLEQPSQKITFSGEPTGVWNTAKLYVAANDEWLFLETGEWVAQDSRGFYPIKNDVFSETYDLKEWRP